MTGTQAAETQDRTVADEAPSEAKSSNGTNGSRRRAAAPRYRTFPAEVVAVERLGNSFRRVTFAGEELRTFGPGGHDQRIKVVLPQPGQTVADFPNGDDWYDQWRAMPDDVRPPMRTYTVRDFRPDLGELDVDFVLHGVDDGHAGPASNWVATAKPGDEVGLIGPDRPGSGRMWGTEWCPPETTKEVLLAGDETAVPAMAAIVESLPAHARGIVCVEVPTPDDYQKWVGPEGIEVRWMARAGEGETSAHGVLLEAAVAAAMAERCGKPSERTSGDASYLEEFDLTILWDVPEAARLDAGHGELYGWLAGEAGMIKRLRRLLVHEYGVPRTAVAFMGYWRRGRTEMD